jgi:hypothetical protein
MPFSRKTIRAAIDRADGSCEKCGFPLGLANPPEVDHIKEQWKGGSDDLSNAQVLGKKCCHSRKTGADAKFHRRADRQRDKRNNIPKRGKKKMPYRTADGTIYWNGKP